MDMYMLAEPWRGLSVSLHLNQSESPALNYFLYMSPTAAQLFLNVMPRST